jgi:hypothetical protein
VTYGYHGTADSPVGHALRWLAEDAPPPATAEALVCREELGAVDRACLLAPAPTTLGLKAQSILGRRLAVSVAVLDVGFALEGDQVVRRTGLSDGVTFAVELAVDGGAPRRVWSRHVTADEGFVSAEVELPGIGAQQVRLRLLTEPGPGGEATADSALWSDLRLRGPRRAPLERPHVVHQPYLDDRRFVEVDYEGPLANLATQQLILKSFHDGKTRANETEVHYLDALYDAGVARMDDMVGRFLEQLDGVFQGDPYLVILTSDHGEELFEHGRQGHGHSLHGEVLDVPLIVRFPDGEPGRVDRPVSSLDIVPTILDVAGLPVPERLAGRPLTREPPERRLRVATHEADAWAVMFDGWKLMMSAEQGDELQLDALYRLTTDPGETRDVLGREPERARRLEELFEQQRERLSSATQTGQQAIVDPALPGDLQALGYLGEDG